MSDIRFQPSNLCYYDFENNHDLTPSTPDNSHVPFQPWLSSLHTSTMNQSQPFTFWSSPANYTSGNNHQQLTYDHYLSPFNQNEFTSVKPEIDNRMTFEQNRPSSVLSTVSSVSTSSTATTVSNPALDIDSGTEPTESISHLSKRKPKSEKYRRYPKPPYSYCALIITSIQNSPNQKLTLSGIISKLMELFEFFRGSYQGWRDCIRHNLSHNSCFYKVPYPLPGEDEITGRKSKGRSYWMVDLSRVPSHVFKILDKKAEKSGKYKSFIHEELGLPEIMLPIKCKTEGENFAIRDAQTQSTIVDDKFIQQSATRHGYRMRLPDVSSCPVVNDSPEQFRRRDLNETVTPLPNTNSGTSPTLKRRKLNETCDNARTENSAELQQQLLWDYVKSITTSVTSSTDAVNNLSDLC